MHVDDVIERLEELNLDYEIEEIFSEDIEAEHVESTDPEAGSIVKEGSIITLFVSRGVELVPLSDYEGQSYSQVERLLIQKGLLLKTFNELIHTRLNLQKVRLLVSNRKQVVKLILLIR